MMQSYNKFLIIQTAFIGDVILATPIIETLHLNFPNAKIHFCLRKGNESLLENHPLIEKTWVWDKKNNKFKNWWKITREIKKEKYDAVICVQRFFSAGLMAVLSGAKEKYGFNKNPLSFLFTNAVKHEINGKQHETQRNIQLLKTFCKKSYTQAKLPISKQHIQNISSYCETSFICIAPASVWFTKQFPLESWVNFLIQIPKHKVYILGAPNDNDLADQIIKKSKHPNVISLCGKISLLESAALMSKAEMNFVNDSAPMHLASAVNAPVAAIFCSTVPEFGFGPLSENAKIIQVKQKLACRPCGLHGKKSCPEQHFSCGNDIEIMELVNTIPVLS